MKYTRTQETMASFVELKQNVVEKEEIILEFDGEDHIRERHMGKRQEFTSQFNIREEDVFTLIWDTIKSLRNNLTWVKKLQYSEMLFSFFSIYVLKFLFTILIVYKKNPHSLTTSLESKKLTSEVYKNTRNYGKFCRVEAKCGWKKKKSSYTYYIDFLDTIPAELLEPLPQSQIDTMLASITYSMRFLDLNSLVISTFLTNYVGMFVNSWCNFWTTFRLGLGWFTESVEV